MIKSLAEQIVALEQAIAAQVLPHPTPGDGVVDATVATLREKLAKLETRAQPEE